VRSWRQRLPPRLLQARARLSTNPYGVTSRTARSVIIRCATSRTVSGRVHSRRTLALPSFARCSMTTRGAVDQVRRATPWPSPLPQADVDVDTVDRSRSPRHPRVRGEDGELTTDRAWARPGHPRVHGKASFPMSTSPSRARGTHATCRSHTPPADHRVRGEDKMWRGRRD
jgi:hypothetical protein